MSQPSSDSEITRLLKELESPDETVRVHAVEQLGRLGVRDPEVIRALEQVANFDSSPQVGTAASMALHALGTTPEVDKTTAVLVGQPSKRGLRKIYASDKEKWIDFAIGFVGWFIVNGAIWHFLSQDKLFNGIYSSLGLCTFPANLLLLILAVISRRWLGLGLLSAMALNLFAALFVGMLINGTCAVPFYVK